MGVLQLIWLHEIIGGMLLMCQNTTMRVYGARIKRYCVLCSKHIAYGIIATEEFLKICGYIWNFLCQVRPNIGKIVIELFSNYLIIIWQRSINKKLRKTGLCFLVLLMTLLIVSHVFFHIIFIQAYKIIIVFFLLSMHPFMQLCFIISIL